MMNVGPCSIHDIDGALQFAKELKLLQEKFPQYLFVMRAHVEKPRSTVGWRGLLLDPALDGSYQVEKGIILARNLFIELASAHIPFSMELLDPFFVPYFSDLISFGVIGARTASSQTHRQLASLQPYPIGFKNGLDGTIDSAIAGMLSCRQLGLYPTLNHEGRITLAPSKGNKHTTLILRGGTLGPNIQKADLLYAKKQLTHHHLNTSFIIDCAHSNSNKNIQKQKELIASLLSSRENLSISGLMIESHLLEGSDPLLLHPLMSITDPCIALESLYELLSVSK